MELYTLDGAGRLDKIIEQIESVIWTERYSAYGDLELIVKSTEFNRNLFVPGLKIVQSLSDRVMVVRTAEDALMDDGKKVLTIRGYSMEAMLQDKVARSNATSFPYAWKMTKTPGEAAMIFVREIVILGLRSVNDIVPNLTVEYPVMTNRIPWPVDPITVQRDPGPLYDAVKEVCDAYDLGFKIVRASANSYVYSVYTGFDRTSTQTANTAVLFSASLDNLQNTREIKSNVDHKNVATVYSEQGAPTDFFAVGTPSTISGEDRKVVLVKADNLDGTPTAAEVQTWFAQVARETLAKYRPVQAFDGEVSQYSPYVYGEDYGLGDLVEYQNEDGDSAVMMVTEQIFALDDQGLRSYPTLTLHVFVQSGSWLAWAQNKEWDDLTTEEWNTMP